MASSTTVETWKELDARKGTDGEYIALMYSPEKPGKVLLLVDDKSVELAGSLARDAFLHPYTYLQLKETCSWPSA